MSEIKHTKLLIIGSGPAGYTAAVYAARAMLEPVLVRGLQPGGQLTITTDVENYPGFADAIQGPWLMEQMEAQAAHVGTEIISDIITKADLNTRPFTMTGEALKLVHGESIGTIWAADQNSNGRTGSAISQRARAPFFGFVAQGFLRQQMR